MQSDQYLANVRALCDISIRRLPAMIDRATGLFIHHAEGEHLRPVSSSVRYTAFAALGLARADDAGLDRVMDTSGALAALDTARPRLENIGDLGLIVWAAARRDRGVAERALDDLLGRGLMVQRGARAYRSSELAWVVTGLAEALANDIGRERDVRARLDAAYRRLIANRGRSGMMAFATWEGGGLRPYLESTLGFFDAQVYTILASLRRDAVVGDREARDVAVTIGRQILRHQGPLGQWAWHYNVHEGSLVDLFPVYSVHQDAMAPLALLALERAEGMRTSEAVARGVAWIMGHNELGVSLADAGRSVIWRSIRRRGPLKRLVYPLKALSLIDPSIRLGASFGLPALLEIDRETRPYHFGLCLYAFADLAASARRETRRANERTRAAS
jgi:hypothetical protein